MGAQEVPPCAQTGLHLGANRSTDRFPGQSGPESEGPSNLNLTPDVLIMSTKAWRSLRTQDSLSSPSKKTNKVSAGPP
jgi:hypothetical protein